MINYKIGDLVTRINTMLVAASQHCEAKSTNKTSNNVGEASSLLLTNVGNGETTLLAKPSNMQKVPYTKDNYQIINLLIKLGILVSEASEAKQDYNTCQKLQSINKNLYFSTVQNTKTFLTLVSKPGRRIYVGYKELNDFNNGLKLYILRTSKGIITSQTAFKYKIGGELLFKISAA